MELPIAECFSSIQGEGRLAGRPAFFIRTAGCNLNCRFCDTNHRQRQQRTVESLVAEAVASGTYHVVITGGEPTIHLPQLNELVHQLSSQLLFVQVETNGYADPPSNNAWITLSPKSEEINIPLRKVHEVKLLVDGYGNISADPERYHRLGCYLSFQPIDPGPDTLAYTTRIAPALDHIRNKWLELYPQAYLTLQQHKIFNWR